MRIDVIIPVYRGFEETRRCIESVLMHTPETEREVIIVNDASPEAALADYVSNLARYGRVTLLTNAENRGFVASVNRAMALHQDRDVVLLNSDTEVHGDWLGRLAACAARHDDTGTVTAFSNNATIASYPRFCSNNALPEGASLAAMDAWFVQANAGLDLRIPTGVGFCLLIRRVCLGAIGQFDETAFGRGYGEENDFCLRASAKGFSHYLCGDVFVWHRGEMSFGAEAQELRNHAQIMLERRYPEYGRTIAGFIKEDPARPLRRRVDLLRIADSPRRKLLFVTHEWGGGVWRHIEDLIGLLRDVAEVLVLRPDREGRVQLTWSRSGEEFVCWFPLPEQFDALVALLEALGIERVHYHHLHGLPASIQDLAKALGVPYDCTIHDYYVLHSNYQLVNSAGRYAEDTLQSDPAWRERYASWLKRAQRIIAPSRDVAERLQRYYRDLAIQVIAHPEAAKATSEQIFGSGALRNVRVLVLGGLSAAKGLGRLEACARDARKRELALTFILLGYAVDHVSQWPEVPLFIRGQYDDSQLETLIGHENPDVIFFPAQWPETYSYTLSAAMRSGVPIVAPRLGAFTERLTGFPSANLIAWDASAAACNDACIGAAKPAPVARPIAQTVIGTPPDAYLAEYLRPFAAVAGLGKTHGDNTCLQIAFPDASCYRELDHDNIDTPSYLIDLFEAGVERGHSESRLQLKRELREFGTRVVELSNEAEHLRRHNVQLLESVTAYQRQVEEYEKAVLQYGLLIRGLERDVEAARARAVELEQSTSWRLTLPLRWSGQHVKTAWRAGKRLWQGARHAGRRTNLAMQILRNGGPLALANRIRDRIGAGHSAQQAGANRFTLAKAIAPLILESAAGPLVSIIIPVYGQHLHTFSCLKSIAENSKGIALEVIVMDDCSPEPAADALAQVQGVRMVRNSANLGFLRTCNKAAREALGQYLVFLNNDTLVLEGWLDALLRAFEIHPAAGVVGAKLIYPDGSLQEAGGILWRDGSGWNYGRGDDPDKPEYNYLRDVDYCSGACLMVPRDLFLDLGGFDEQYAPAYCEDSDLCLAVRKAGRRVLYQPAARVVHFEGISHGTNVSEGLKAYQAANARKQFAKWQAELATHRINGMAPELERDRGAGRRMLYIDATMVTPDQDSGSLRVSRVLKAARKHGCKVTFIADNLEYLPPYVGEIQEAGIEVQYYPYLKSIEDYLERCGAYYDVIILSRYYVAEKYIDCVRKYAPQAILALDTHDLHFLRLRRLAELEGSASAAQSAERTYAREMKVMRACDVTLVVSHVEREILAECLAQATVKIFTNIHDVAEEIAPFGNRKDLMFVGGYRHPPNVDAVIWYAMEVLPEVKRRLPGVKTYIIGSNPPESITSLADEALEVVGFVPDMTPYLRGCRLSISPLRYGAGVKGKVNQAMSFGLPVVATTTSVEGMHLQDGVEVLVADSPSDFAAAIEKIYRDVALWTRVSKASQENVRAHFSEDAAWCVMAEMFEMAEQGAARRGKV